MEFCSLKEAKINTKRIDGLIERVCLTLEYSDPGRILSLLRSLYENSASILQMKINRYLEEVTKSVSSFIILSFLRKNEHKITVIGEKNLALDMDFTSDCDMMKYLLEYQESSYIDLPKLLIQEGLRNTIENHIVELYKDRDELVELSNVLAVPVRHPVSQRVLMFVVLVNTSRIVDYRRISSELVNECLRYCAGILVNSVCYQDEKSEHERARHFIEIMRQMLLNIENVKEMIDEIRLRICDLMAAERCAIYLRDSCGAFITNILDYGEQTDLAEEPLKNVVLPPNFSLAGMVAETGNIFISNDVVNDARYCMDLDDKTGNFTRNVICFPLRRGDNVVGVIEVYNKVPSKETDSFTYSDRIMAEALSVMMTPLLFHCLNYKKLQENLDRRNFTDQFYARKIAPTDEEVEKVLKCEEIHNYHEYLHLNFSQLKMSRYHLGCLIYDYFNKFGLIRHFDIRPAVLVRFILSIFNHHPEFPFHNWQHTFGTFHFISVLVNELNLVSKGICTYLEILGLMIASLCHNVDYRGSINVFQVSSGMTLASLYSSPAHINQQFQSSQAFRLIHKPETNILENIPAEQFQVVTRLIKKLINVADMGCYLERLTRMEETMKSIPKRDELEQRLDMLALFMGCAVLSDYSKDFKHCRRIAEKTLAEFLPKVDVSRAGGIFDLNQFTATVELVPHIQIEIINTVCSPSFRILSELFPVTYPCYQRCRENLDTWHRYKDQFQQIYDEEELERLFFQEHQQQEEVNNQED